jgi:hypothetical protein
MSGIRSAVYYIDKETNDIYPYIVVSVAKNGWERAFWKGKSHQLRHSLRHSYRNRQDEDTAHAELGYNQKELVKKYETHDNVYTSYIVWANDHSRPFCIYRDGQTKKLCITNDTHKMVERQHVSGGFMSTTVLVPDTSKTYYIHVEGMVEGITEPIAVHFATLERVSYELHSNSVITNHDTPFDFEAGEVSREFETDRVKGITVFMEEEAKLLSKNAKIFLKEVI